MGVTTEAATGEGRAARAREAAMTTGVLLDVSINLTKLVAAIWGNSLTMLGDWLRGALLTILDIFLLMLMRRIHRGRIGGYDYGTRKLEQFVNMLVGSAMILAALWLAATTFLRSGSHPAQSAHGLAFATLAALLNLAINAYVLWRLWRADRDGGSIIMQGLVASRLMKTLASLGVTIAIGANLAFRGSPIGEWADVLGSALVVVTMLGFGARIIGHSLPHLLDRALAETPQAAINQALAHHFDDYEELLAVRTRTEGRDAWIEIEIAFAPDRPLGEVETVGDSIAQRLGELIPRARVLVIPRASRRLRG